MLGDDQALRAVFAEYLQAPTHPEGATFINHSTVSPRLTEELAQQATAKGIPFLSCPVFGRPDAAAAKQILVVSAGEPAARSKVGMVSLKYVQHCSGGTNAS